MTSATDYEYDAQFYSFLATSSSRSAAAVVPVVLRALNPSSVLDIGCGAGAWLAEYVRNGVVDVLGVDGDYVKRSALHISPDRFIATDVSRRFRLNRRFDLVQCLEVAEHVPESQAGQLVENIVAHGNVVLFSAAVPGQGGENHVNEQPLEYWRMAFERHGYYPFDCIRPAIATNDAVESWYRYNSLLYVQEGAVPMLSPALLSTKVQQGRRISDLSPFSYRVRCAVLRAFPESAVTGMARVKHRVLTAMRRTAVSSN